MSDAPAGESKSADGQPSHTLVYDGDCKVCYRVTSVLRKLDRAHSLEIVPFQEPGVQARFPWIPPHAYAASMQLVGPRGQTWQGAAAVEQILNVIPRGKWVAWLFRIPLISALAEIAYRWFARHRYRLGCDSHCQLANVDSAQRLQ